MAYPSRVARETIPGAGEGEGTGIRPSPCSAYCPAISARAVLVSAPLSPPSLLVTP